MTTTMYAQISDEELQKKRKKRGELAPSHWMLEELDEDKNQNLLGITTEHDAFFRQTSDNLTAQMQKTVEQEQILMKDHIDEYINEQIDVETEKKELKLWCWK